LDYLKNNLINKEVESLNLNNNSSDDELNIYLKNDEEESEDELALYFKEKRATKSVSYIFIF
jgi:hypothetical protein